MLRFDLTLARELGLPVALMRALMPMSEYRDWRALAMIENQIADLVHDGTDPATASRLAWTLQTDDPDEER